MLVLAIEDCTTHQLILHKMFKKLDVECIVVGTIRAAFEELHNSEDIAIIITDLFLPDIDASIGVKVLRDRGVDIPIVILTAGYSDTVIKRCLESGATRVISKPCFMEKMTELLQELAPQVFKENP